MVLRVWYWRRLYAGMVKFWNEPRACWSRREKSSGLYILKVGGRISSSSELLRVSWSRLSPQRWMARSGDPVMGFGSLACSNKARDEVFSFRNGENQVRASLAIECDRPSPDGALAHHFRTCGLRLAKIPMPNWEAVRNQGSLFLCPAPRVVSAADQVP